jgi:hypothetical protein
MKTPEEWEKYRKEHQGSPIWRYTVDLEILEKEFSFNKKLLNDRLKQEQDQCIHKNTHYEADPSGNHDSYRECLNCGKIL